MLYIDITQAYAIAAGGIFTTLFFVNLLPYVMRFTQRVLVVMCKHLTYPYAIRRHRLFGPWTRAGVLVQLVYITANLFCLSYRVSKISQAGLRAATLSLINLTPLFAGPHLGFVADLLGISLTTYRQVHGTAGLGSFGLLAFHVLQAVSGGSYSLATRRNVFGLVGVAALCFLITFSYPVFRRLSFEIFLRTHQALALLVIYAAWRHLPSSGIFPRFYLYLSAALFLTTFVFETGSVLYRNGLLRHGRSKALISHAHGTIKISIRLSKPLFVKPGQYINLWIPSVSFWAFLQTHPLVVTSWADAGQSTLEFFVQPRRGLTREILYHAEADEKSGARTACWVLFSGPHGTSAPVGEFENVLMIADGFGIAAHLPYIERLVHGYNARKIRTRRIHLVWQLKNIEIGIAAQSLLNRVLDDDTVDRGYIFHISIYLESGNVETMAFGRRVTVSSGTADIRNILQREAAGESLDGVHKDIEMLQEDTTRIERGKMFVMVSGTDEQRDNIRGLVRGYLDDDVTMVELDYQPTQR